MSTLGGTGPGRSVCQLYTPGVWMTDANKFVRSGRHRHVSSKLGQFRYALSFLPQLKGGFSLPNRSSPAARYLGRAGRENWPWFPPPRCASSHFQSTAIWLSGWCNMILLFVRSSPKRPHSIHRGRCDGRNCSVTSMELGMTLYFPFVGYLG